MRMAKPARPEAKAFLNMRSIIIGLALLLLLVAAGLRFADYLRGDAATSITATGSTEQIIVVDVKGAVLSSGLYQLPLGSRVEDALRQAGLADNAAPELLNRAALLADGSELIVPINSGPID